MVYILFVLGFVILLKGADILVEGASALAAKYKISPLVIGLTIVAFGSSAPELLVNVMASYKGNADLAISNVLGSNIANILLMLGLTALFYPLAVHKNTVKFEIPIAFIALLLIALFGNEFLVSREIHLIDRVDGIVLLIFFCAFLYYVWKTASASDDEEEIQKMGALKAILFIILGLAGLGFGGDWIVGGAIEIVKKFGISESLVGLTIVSVGTSLPELAATFVAAKKGKSDLALGNIVGSNIFNALFVLGVSATIRAIPYNLASNEDLIVCLSATALLFLCLFFSKGHRLFRSHGILFLIIYFSYLAYSIAQG